MFFSNFGRNRNVTKWKSVIWPPFWNGTNILYFFYWNMVVISVYTYGVKIIKKIRWESGFLGGVPWNPPPRYALTEVRGTLMQLSVTNMHHFFFWDTLLLIKWKLTLIGICVKVTHKQQLCERRCNFDMNSHSYLCLWLSANIWAKSQGLKIHYPWHVTPWQAIRKKLGCYVVGRLNVYTG